MAYFTIYLSKMWEDFNYDNTKSEWSKKITIFFSIFSGAANVISPLLCTYLHDK